MNTYLITYGLYHDVDYDSPIMNMNIKIAQTQAENIALAREYFEEELDNVAYLIKLEEL